MQEIVIRPENIIHNEDGSVVVSAGDIEFQKTLTPKEMEYLNQGENMIDKIQRETVLKTLHNVNYTLDEVDDLPTEERKKVWLKAIDEWENKDK